MVTPRVTALVLVLSLGGLVACATTAGHGSTQPIDTPPATANAPAPFTAAQIRDATRPGRTYVFRVESPGQPTGYRVIRFVAVSDARTTTESTMEDRNRQPVGEPERHEVTWDELVRHGTYPADRTTIIEETLETPLGSLACWRYDVQGKGGLTRVWFARSLPGAPVRHEAVDGGRVVRSMTMVERHAGD